MLCTEKSNVDQVNIRDAGSIDYHQLSEEEGWKVTLIKELTDLKHGRLEMENFSHDEIDDMISMVCTS